MTEEETRQVFERLQQGDTEAACEVFERYLDKLVGLARARMSEKLGRKLDADDIVQSAFRSFFNRAQDGQYAIERAGDLWKLLAAITRNKLLKKAEYYRQQKRNMNQDQPLAAGGTDREDLFALEPTAEEGIALADELEHLMRGLDPMHRRILELRLSGKPIPEIADEIERSERTVRRFLGSFREELEQRLQSLSSD